MVEAKRAWRGFWTWWGSELLALVPGGLRSWLGIGERLAGPALRRPARIA